MWEDMHVALYPALISLLSLSSFPWLLGEGVESSFLFLCSVIEHKILAKQICDLDPEWNI